MAAGNQATHDLTLYFEHLDEYAHRDIFRAGQAVWAPLCNLRAELTRILAGLRERAAWTRPAAGVKTAPFRARGGLWKENCLCVEDWLEAQTPLFFEELDIFIGAGTLLEPTAIIKGPAVIGGHCEVRQGAYLRGNVLAGEHCVLGHATEVKNSIFMNHTESGHFNYIGDSILGSYVNMGAGSKLANLQLRTAAEKRQGFIRPVVIKNGADETATGMEKLGAVVGDYVELGCNAVTCPGALIGKHNWIVPNTTVPKGFYPPNHFIGPREHKPLIRPR